MSQDLNFDESSSYYSTAEELIEETQSDTRSKTDFVSAPHHSTAEASLRLSDRHYEECVTKRGLNPEWISVNARSMTTKEAGDRLGYTAKSAGIWLEGYDGFGQFRPDNPWKAADEDQKKKAPKYRTATKEEYDAMLPKHPHDKNYWTDLEALRAKCYMINGHPCLGITEGMFKAIAACSNDIPCVALAGVEQGLTSAKKDIQGRRYLVGNLEKFACEGFGLIILFDADSAVNPAIIDAQRKLAAQLAMFEVPVYVSSGLWSMQEGKGMDDYIQKNGADKFKREVLGKVIDIAAWEKQFEEKKDQGDGDRVTQASFIRQFTDSYRARLAWNVQAKAWYWYEAKNKPGVWGEIPGEETMDLVLTELEAINYDYSSNFVAGVLTLLKAKLRVNDWEVVPGLVCLEDCVIDIRTLEVNEHQPGYRFLSRLPFKWSDREVGCEPIKQWLLEVCADCPAWVEVLRAGMNATITERGGKLQRYMELIGAGGTGKGTILRLLQSLLGKDNYAVTTLKEIEQNRFESAKFYGKKAIFITDSDRYAGDVSRLKAITGDDEIPIEKKGVQQTGGYRFTGVVWVAANEAIQSSDYTNALARRRLSMSFERVVPPHLRRDLNEEFKQYLPGLLFWVLSMPADEVADYVGNTTKRVPSLAKFSTEILLDTNPLANWADQCLYYDPSGEAKIGDANGEPSLNLYANYSQWSDANGQRRMTTQRFSNILLNLLKTQLGIDAIKRKTNRGRFITKIGIRQPGHDFPPLFSRSDDLSDDLKAKSDDSVTTLVTTQSIGSYGFQESDDLLVNSLGGQSPSSTACLPNREADEGGTGRYFGSTSSPASVSGRHQEVSESSSNNSQVVTNYPENAVTASIEKAESIGSDDTQPFSHQVISESSPNNQVVTSSVTTQEVTTQEVTTQDNQVVTPSLTQRIIAAWDDAQALGKIILAIADTAELRAELSRSSYTPERLKHIKSAAAKAWKPGCNTPGEYLGEKVELMEFGSKKDWVVKSYSSKSQYKVRRVSVNPWLGL